MTWFQPLSFEMLYKFELIGLLMSVAIHNGMTLPVTFPLAFYRKILGQPVSEIHHIQDGWPDQSRSFQQLLDWKDGDVGDVFMSTYEFTMHAFGQSVSVDMQKVKRHEKWPKSDRMPKWGTFPPPALADRKGKARAVSISSNASTNNFRRSSGFNSIHGDSSLQYTCPACYRRFPTYELKKVCYFYKFRAIRS
jgi:HECT-domain (ubiquitin-transferase)